MAFRVSVGQFAVFMSAGSFSFSLGGAMNVRENSGLDVSHTRATCITTGLKAIDIIIHKSGKGSI